jgi:membrane-associated phospholipid phosphatase
MLTLKSLPALIGIALTMPATAFAADSALAGFGNDVLQYVTSPIRWDSEDWLWFGGTLAAIGTAHAFDERVREHFAPLGPEGLTGRSKNSLRDAAPTAGIVVATFGYAVYLNDRDGYHETWSLVEAALFSTATATAFGYATGRERPDQTTSPNHWFKGGDSFPSVHASAAFAVGAVFAESGNDEYRWIRRILGYGVAAGTAYIRIKDNDHWLSDTVAGTAIGLATAHFVLHKDDSGSKLAEWHVQPERDGWSLQYQRRF